MRTEIRTFVALKIHPCKKVLHQLNDFKTAFAKDNIKWVNEDQFHVTLRFIGNTTRNQLCNLVDGIELVASQSKSFQLEIKGIACFSRKGKPQVLHAKVSELDALKNLVQAIERVVVLEGFHEELKPFRPHVTLGRIKHLESSGRFSFFVKALHEIKYQDVTISEITLYQSILNPEGPIYKAIKTFQLK